MSKRNDQAILAKTKRAVQRRNKGYCEVCSIFLATEIHHITPRVDGGNNDLKNLANLCTDCHKRAPDSYPDGFEEEFEIYKEKGGIRWQWFRLGFMTASCNNSKDQDCYIKAFKKYKQTRCRLQKQFKKSP